MEVRVYICCVKCKATFPFKFQINQGLEPLTALAPAKCPKCRESKTPIAWDKFEKQIVAIGDLKSDWDGEGAESIPPETIASARKLAAWLPTAEFEPPQDVYPLPDGNIILEWQLPNKIIKRIEIGSSNEVDLMITYPDQPAYHTTLIIPDKKENQS